MRIPLALRVVAGVLCAVLLIWATALIVQGRYGLSLIAGAVGSLLGQVAFAPMRESAY